MKVVALENAKGNVVALTECGKTFILKNDGSYFYWEELFLVSSEFAEEA